VGAGEPHESAEADQLLVQQEHHGRPDSRVDDDARRAGAPFIDRSTAGEPYYYYISFSIFLGVLRF